MNNKNIELTVLKTLGIIVVVSCHLGINMFNLIGIPLTSSTELFPEYSYHMPLFIFASGYFYKRIYESDILNLTKKRFKSIKKYMNCNLFYFCLCFVLVSFGIFSRNIEFNFKSIFIEPFLGGFQFYFNGPGWFVPFLFILQITYTYLRKVIGLKFKSFNNQYCSILKQESIFFISLIILGFISTSISNIYPVINDNMNILQSFLRILFGLQFFQLGFIYKEFIQKNIKFSFLSFFLVIICKFIVFLSFGYYTFSLRTIKFNNHSILPFVVSILGIIYCLHLTKFIVNISSKLNSKALSFIYFLRNNTWSIMMHHLLVKWSLDRIYDLSFMPNNFKLIGNYFISHLLCILLPIGFVYLYKNMEYGLLFKNKLVIFNNKLKKAFFA